MAASNLPSSTSPLAGVAIDSGEPLTMATFSEPAASSPVELSELSARQQNDHTVPINDATPSSPVRPTADTAAVEQPDTSAQLNRLSLSRKDTEAIGPASDQPLPATDSASGPTLMITLLLPSGARHPFKIDGKYLSKRNMQAEENNPVNLSVYNMKELIWRDWRTEWEPRPSSPTYIRLIFFGAMLDDKAVLKDCKFNTGSPNVVHMSVKPQDIVDEEDVKNTKQGRRSSESGGREAGCCCIIQ